MLFYRLNFLFILCHCHHTGKHVHIFINTVVNSAVIQVAKLCMFYMHRRLSYCTVMFTKLIVVHRPNDIRMPSCLLYTHIYISK